MPDSTPHSRLDSEKALLLGLNALRLEVPSPVWEDIYERATAYVKEANSLFEQLEAQRRTLERIRDWRDFRHTGEVRDAAAAALSNPASRPAE